MIDISAVLANCSFEDLEEMVSLAKRYKFIAVFGMPCYMENIKEMLLDEKDIRIGGVVGFPSGADSTFIKRVQAKWCVEKGANEIDMVINIGWLLSGWYKKVIEDIKSVKDAIGDMSLKVILEVGYLNDDQIKKGSESIVLAGAQYVKTGTGWASPTTLRHIDIIKSTVGNRIKIKAAGGVKNLDTLYKMYEHGVTRFGLGTKSVNTIIEQYFVKTIN